MKAVILSCILAGLGCSNAMADEVDYSAEGCVTAATEQVGFLNGLQKNQADYREQEAIDLREGNYSALRPRRFDHYVVHSDEGWFFCP
jgi:hypothetical protein